MREGDLVKSVEDESIGIIIEKHRTHPEFVPPLWLVLWDDELELMYGDDIEAV